MPDARLHALLLAPRRDRAAAAPRGYRAAAAQRPDLLGGAAPCPTRARPAGGAGIVHALFGWVGSLPPALTVFLLSLMPVSELRGGIPYGLLVAHLPLWQVELLAIGGCWLSAPIVYFI